MGMSNPFPPWERLRIILLNILILILLNIVFFFHLKKQTEKIRKPISLTRGSKK